MCIAEASRPTVALELSVLPPGQSHLNHSQQQNYSALKNTEKGTETWI